MAAPPAPQTLLPLLEHLLNSALAARGPKGWVRLEAVELGPVSVVLKASLVAGQKTIGGTHRESQRWWIAATAAAALAA